ncbi:MAG TPA: HEAT repeat domain-containing protein, partial [Pirellulales bacterium]|nr:HEAT repeat domain-containing protein [Pirellulales bacterium]
WSRISDTEMADILGDPRPAVAERAVEVLALRGDAAMGSLATALFENTDFRARQNGVWALARNGSDSARQLLRQALDDDEAPVRQAAAHAVSDLRDADSLPRLVAMLSDDDLAVRREVAAALGRLGQKAAVPALLAALEKPSDRFVEHAVIFALIEINDRASTLAGIAHSSARVRRGALVALDQMDDGRLTSDLVAELLATDDPALLAAVVDVVTRHPDWSATLEGLVNQWLALAEPSPEQLAMARGALAAFAPREATQTVMAKAVAAPQTAKEVRLMLLELMSRAEFETVGDRWSKAVADCLAASDSDVLEQAILAAEALKLRELTARLVELGLETSQPSAVRVAAWHAASQTKLSLPPAGFTFLTEVLADATQPALRRTAAEALGSFALSEDQRALLPQYIERLGPLEISWLLRVFESGGSSDSGLAVVTALTKSPALSSLSGQRVRETFANYPPEVRAAAEKLAERSSPDERARAAQLAALAKELADGEAAKGEDVFYGARAACSACHRIGHRGEKIGPDLSKIGEVRTRADLVEAIVFPSASLARGFESFQVLTKAGKIHGGLLSRETAAAIYLRTTDRAEIRIDRDDLDELTPSRTSIMPQGLEQVLSRRELADLISFLQSLK